MQAFISLTFFTNMRSSSYCALVPWCNHVISPHWILCESTRVDPKKSSFGIIYKVHYSESTIKHCWESSAAEGRVCYLCNAAGGGLGERGLEDPHSDHWAGLGVIAICEASDSADKLKYFKIKHKGNSNIASNKSNSEASMNRSKQRL